MWPLGTAAAITVKVADDASTSNREALTQRVRLKGNRFDWREKQRARPLL